MEADVIDKIRQVIQKLDTGGVALEDEERALFNYRQELRKAREDKQT